jgi:hypothetical protein
VRRGLAARARRPPAGGRGPRGEPLTAAEGGGRRRRPARPPPPRTPPPVDLDRPPQQGVVSAHRPAIAGRRRPSHPRCPCPLSCHHSQLDFGRSGGVAEAVGQVVDEGAGDFDDVAGVG